MTNVTASQVKELREKTGAGMMDAKKALVENNGDVEASIDWLRKKGLAKAEKKSSRTAAEGLVALQATGNKGVVVEINSETDFVARNEKFQGFVEAAVGVAMTGASSVEELAAADMNGKSVQDTLTDLIATIGENMSLRRMAVLEVSQGVVASYVHNASAQNMGKIGVLVALESEGDQDKLQALGKQIAMHVAAAFPQYLDQSRVDAAVVEKERAIVAEQTKAEGKPDHVVEKIVDGRIGKFYQEICLVDQVFVIDGKAKVSEFVEQASKDIGAPITIKDFVRFQLGEGIEVEEEDFAAEVAKTAAGG